MKNLLIITSIIAINFSCAPAFSAAKDSAGCMDYLNKHQTWNGFYTQQGVDVEFSLNLKRTESKTNYAGESVEKDTRPGHSGSIEADWSGEFTNGTINLIKVYRVANVPPIKYTGACGKNSNEIKGVWIIDVANTGTFRISPSDNATH